MWTKHTGINKHLFIDDDDFDLIHFIEDCYRIDKVGLSNLLLFEHNSLWYIAELEENVSELSFNIDMIDNQGYTYSDGSDWYLVKPWSLQTDIESPVWKFIKDGAGDIIHNNKAIGNKYKLNVSTMVFEPFPVASGSEDVSSYNISLNRKGVGVYKSDSKLGVYEWQGEGEQDDIIVGYRKYKHKALDSEGNPTSEDIFITSSVELINYTSGRWSYKYKGKTYYYYDQLLPLSNITLETTESEELNLTYVELVTLNKKINIFDGGAQNVV